MADAASQVALEDPGVEPEGVHFAPVFLTFAATIVFLVVLIVVGFEVAQKAFVTAEYDAATRTGYPLLRETASDAQALLSRYEIVDSEAERYRIPIDRAIDLIVNEAANTSAEPSGEVRLTR